MGRHSQSERNYWLLSGALFAFFLAWSFCFSLFPIWLNQVLGLSGESTGIIFGINAFWALLVMPFYGYLQDKLGFRRHLLICIALGLVLIGPFFLFVYAPLLQTYFLVGAMIGGLVFALLFNAGVCALETYVERVGRATGFEFGKARMWGSLGWAFATFFAGRFINLEPALNFILASLCALLFVLLLALVRPTSDQRQGYRAEKRASMLQLHDALSLLRLSAFWRLTWFVVCVHCVYGVYDQQFPIYFASLFPTRAEGNILYGYLNSIQVLLEAGGLFLAPILVNRIGARQGLILSGLIMTIRILGSGLVEDTLGISAIKLLHAVELPILLVSIFKYIAINFDRRLSATLYLVGFQFSTQLMTSIFSILAGRMYDLIGFAMSYRVMGIIVAIGTLVSVFLLSNKEPQTPLPSKLPC